MHGRACCFCEVPLVSSSSSSSSTATVKMLRDKRCCRITKGHGTRDNERQVIWGARARSDSENGSTREQDEGRRETMRDEAATRAGAKARLDVVRTRTGGLRGNSWGQGWHSHWLTVDKRSRGCVSEPAWISCRAKSTAFSTSTILTAPIDQSVARRPRASAGACGQVSSGFGERGIVCFVQ